MFSNFNNDYQEVIFFFEENHIVKEMYHSEFEAVLDGVVGMPEFSGKVIRSAYLNIDSGLNIVSCVLFKLSFDREGRPPQKWNLPLRNLADRAGNSPAIEGHHFRLSCRSQCSISWYAKELWDPELNNPELNSLILIMNAVRRNLLNMQGVYRHPSSFPSMDQGGALDPYGLKHASGFSNYDNELLAQQQAKRDKPVLQAVKEVQDKKTEWRKIEHEQRERLASVLTEQRQKMKKIIDSHQEEIHKIKDEYERRLATSKNELHSITLKVNDYSGMVDNLNSELDLLKRKYAQAKESSQVDAKKAVERITEEYEKITLTRIADASQEYLTRMSRLESELTYRKQTQSQLREELSLLRKEKLKWAHLSSNDIVHKLNESGVKFVIFHPGMGYVTLSLNKLESYMTNPIAFVSARCLVSEEHYRSWLSHYNDPTCCHFEGDKNRQVCGSPIRREDVPASFVLGESDCCIMHRHKDQQLSAG